MFVSNELLLSDKQFKILKSLDNCDFMLAVSKCSDVTYSHVYKVVNLFVDRGLVVKDVRDGRIRRLSLTSSGRELLDLYLRVVELLGGGV